MRSRSRSRSRSREPPKRSRRSYSSSRRPMSVSRGLSNPLRSVTMTKSCEIRMQCNTTGYSWNVGLTPSTTFSIWFTPQDVFIWSNTTNYSTVSVPGYTDLAALFDEIMIEKVEIQIFTGNDATTAGSGSAQIIYCTDYNDKNAPSNTGDVQQYADVRAMNMSNQFINKMSIRPKFLTFALDSAGITQASTPVRGYTRSNLAVEHYGIKAAFINIPPNSMFHTYQFKFIYKCRTFK